MPQFLNSTPPLPSSYHGTLAAQNSTESKYILCHFYNPWARTAPETTPLLLHVRVCVETCLLNCSIATAVLVTSLIVKTPLLLRAGIS
jgi:hypothetical protein